MCSKYCSNVDVVAYILAMSNMFQFRIHKKFDHVEVRNYSDSTEFSEISIINSNFYNLSLNLSADENLMKP